MRVIIQRVEKAAVTIKPKNIKREINKGIVILLGISKEDDEKDVEYLVEKICSLRIFSDQQERLNLSLKDVNGGALLISQFTLYGDCRKGRRPDFTNVASKEKAKLLYDKFYNMLKKKSIPVEQGDFGKHMLVEIYNDGPVTFILETKSKYNMKG